MECAGKYGITLGYSLCHWYYYLCRFGNRIQKKVYKQINKFYIAVMHYGVWLLIFLRKEQMQMKLVLAEKPSVGSYSGFQMELSFDSFRNEFDVTLKGAVSHRVALARMHEEISQDWTIPLQAFLSA